MNYIKAYTIRYAHRIILPPNQHPPTTPQPKYQPVKKVNLMLLDQDRPAAIDCPLSGAYLIEASAGTGKTWTLTGIILRLLIEKNTPAQKIVATTFTRAAAKEMQERIYERLVEFDNCCEWLQRYWQHALPPDGDTTTTPTHHPIDWQAILDKSPVPALQDPINRYLLGHIINRVDYRHLASQLDKVRHRIKLLLAELDKLFVGTLDSLAQKWLREFSHEIGEYKADEVLGNSDKYIQLLVHDKLRAVHAKLHHTSPLLYACINKKQLGDTPAMCSKISNALQFYSSPIDEPALVDEALMVSLQDKLSTLLLAKFDDFTPYYDTAFAYAQGMKKNSIFTKALGQLPSILDTLNAHGLMGFEKLDKTQKDWLDKLDDSIVDKIFNNNHHAEQCAWQALPLHLLLSLGQLYKAYQQAIKNFDYQLMAHVANDVRQKLPSLLMREQKTSFTLQMVRLVHALQGRQGRLLARHIRHLYPVALIDESQDLNGEQARLIASIYLDCPHEERRAFFDKKGFLLLVGDPKQAIYRFRGGDVANYNWLKTLGLNSDYALLVNRRSNQRLIQALNAWFGVGETALPSNPSSDPSDTPCHLNNLGDGIHYHAIRASNTTCRLSWHNSPDPKAWLGNTPLTLLNLDNDSDEITAIAWHINAILQSDERYADTHAHRAIYPSDIAVLVNTHKQANQIKNALNALNIAADVAEQGNVFVGQAADELALLFDAIIHLREDSLGGLLTGLFRYSLAQATSLLQDEHQRAELVLYLKQLQKLWYDNSLSAMLMTAFAKPPFINQSLWAYWASFEHSTRYLADMWQLFEIICVWQHHPSAVLTQMAMCVLDKNASYERLAIPSPSAVQVMTIHKSKGLEFAIVYVLELTKEIKKESNKLYPYTHNHQRRLSPTPHHHSLPQGDGKDYFANLDKQEDLDEHKRLGYVALTRASEQLFVVAKNIGKTRLCALQEWQLLDKGQVSLPARLSGLASLIKLDDLVGEQPPYQGAKSHEQAYAYPDFDSIYTQKQFYGVSHTSFTRLSKQLHAPTTYQSPSQSAHQKDQASLGDDSGNQDDHVESALLASQAIATGFARGAVAGTFLHGVLDRVNKGTSLPKAIYSQQQRLGLQLSPSTQDKLTTWLQKVFDLPFLASQATWQMIPATARQSELGFTLGTQPLVGARLAKLIHLFNRYSNYPLPDLSAKAGEVAWLVGEIDLLYSYDGRYYVVDYKSNFLGASPNDYHYDNLVGAMNEHAYWLQAALYQLALHRLLRLRIADYTGNENRYLGAVEYVFLRGLSDDNLALGRLVWQVPTELVLALDAFFCP